VAVGRAMAKAQGLCGVEVVAGIHSNAEIKRVKGGKKEANGAAMLQSLCHC
jgi:hypothetical protein